jgi:hypothetical protein
MRLVSELINQSQRTWNGLSPATETELEELKNSVESELPQEFLDLLRVSNGGEGDIALLPLIFKLDETQEIISLQNDDFYKREFPNFFFFGGNGNIEMIAFDLRKKPYSIVMIDPIGGEGSTIEIAPNITEFIKAIGLEYKDA